MIPFVTGRGTGGANSGSFSVNVGSAPQRLPGDLMIMLAETANEALSPPSGWTEAPNSPSIKSGGGDPTRLHVFWKRAGSSESNPASGDSGDHQVCQIFFVRGAIESGDPFDVSAAGNGSGTSISITGATTTVNDCLIVAAVASTQDGVDSTTNFSSWANSNLSNVFEICDVSGSAGTGGAVGACVGGLATAGVIGSTTVTQATSVDYATWVGAIKPAATNRPYLVGIGGTGDDVAAITMSLPVVQGSGLTTSVLENDILVCVVETNNEAVTISGYTEAASSPASNAGTNPTRLTAFYKRAGPSESDPTTSDSGDHQTGRVYAFRNCIASGDPFDVTGSTTGGVGTTLTIPSVTTTKDNTLIVLFGGTTRNSLSTSTISGWTNAALTDLVAIDTLTSSDGTGGGYGTAIASKPSAGVIGSTTATQATSVEWTGWVGALKFSNTAPSGGTNHGAGFFMT